MLTNSDNGLAKDIFADGGEMGALMRGFDWSNTALGPLEQWSPTLRMMTRFLLMNRFPLLLWWGPQFCQLYNDAYRPVLGKKHPHAALGQPASQCWPEIWHVIGPLIKTPYEGGPPTWMEDIPLEINRYGFMEETHFTIAYSPVPDDTAPSGIGGVLATVHEISEKIVGERRVLALRELAARQIEAKSAEEACAVAAVALANYSKDVPFALLYLTEADGTSARLAGTAGTENSAAICLETVDLREGSDAAWPLASARQGEEIIVADALQDRFDCVPPGPWSNPPDSAAIVPIKSNVAHQLAGYLVAGISPRLRFDDSYRGFLELASAQIATTIANARAYEEERKRAQALAEIDQAKTAFFTNISHEFRTPLTLMLSPLEETIARAEAGKQFGPEDKAQLDFVQRNGMRLLKLVNTLLDFSRIEAGRAKAVYQPTDLAEFTAELASVFRSATEKAGLQLTIDCKPLRHPVNVDRDMWEKIVLNLLSNAFKFTFEGSITVRLTEEEDDHSVCLQVSDTGTGIAQSEIPRLFERFHQVNGSRRRSFEGTGIGLALVQELIHLHGGSIRAESEYGKGTTFTVTIPRRNKDVVPKNAAPQSSSDSARFRARNYLDEAMGWLPDSPAAAATGASAAEGTSTPEAQSGARVLVADDNADMREYVRRLLAKHYTVQAVADGAEALAAALAGPPDLVLTDVMMPELDGVGLLKALREEPGTRSIPVIMLSARAGTEARIEGLQAGADDYLIKPFTARELLARVQSQLALSNLRRNASLREHDLRAEAEAERNRIRDFFTQAPIPIAVLSGPEHRIALMNNGYVRITGRTHAGELEGKTIREALPELEGQPFFDLLDNVYRSGNPFYGNEIKSILDRGATGQPEEAYFNFVYQPTRDANGQVEGIVVAAYEVSEQVRARRRVELNEALLQQEKRILELIAAGAPLPAVLEELTLGIEKRFTEYGILASVLLLDPSGKHLRHGAAPSLHDAYNRAIDGIAIGPAEGSCGTAAYLRKRIIVSDIAHDSLWKNYAELALTHGLRSCWSTPIMGSENQVLGTFAIYYRTSKEPGAEEMQAADLLARVAAIAIERKRIETALRNSEKLAAVGRLASSISHEINNPLESVTNLLYLIQQAATDRELQAYTRTALEELARVSNIVTHTLRFNRQMNAASSEKMSELLDSTVAIYEGRLKNSGIRLVRDYGDNAPVQCLASEIRQVFSNLIGNAFDATRSGGTILLRARNAVDWRTGQRGVRVTVADTGRGMDSNTLAHIFEPFFTTKGINGTGLGLWISAEILRGHEAQFRVRSSQNDGQSGTVFSLHFPLDTQIETKSFADTFNPDPKSVGRSHSNTRASEAKHAV